jgi:hypothetical protein
VEGHAHLDGPEGLLNHLLPLAHGLRVLISRRCTASNTSLCSQRVIRRSVAVVQRLLNGLL